MDPAFLVETSEFAALLNDIGDKVTEDMSEDEVQMVFLNEGYFRKLGYHEIGNTLRSEVRVDGQQPDYVTTGNGATQQELKNVVYEFKNPDRNEKLRSHQDQLERYVDVIGAQFGVLTDGIEFRLYSQKVTGLEDRIDFRLSEATESEAGILLMVLGYYSIRERNLREVASAAAKEVVDSLPDEIRISATEPQVERFAEFLAEFLTDEFEKQGPGEGRS